MNLKKRQEVKNKILKNYELYKLQHSKFSRFKRFLKSPIKTLVFFVLVFFSYIKPFKVKYKTFWGDNMSFYLPEGNAIYYYGFFEANLSNFFLNFLKEGDTVFDVGAHVGYYSMLASVLVGENGSVYSFEPTPRTFNSLEKNSHNKNNIVVNNNAVLNTETEISFIDYGAKYSAFNSFHKRTSKDTSFLKKMTEIKVKTISLDNYCIKKNLKPDFIKIDAEGAEYLILEAMDNILNNIKPLVSIEVAGGDEWRENCSKSIGILKNKGYFPFEITLEGFLSPHQQKDVYLYDNLIFIHNEKIDSLKYLFLK